MLEVNVLGAFNIVQRVLPYMQEQGEGQIALCGSVAGYAGLPGGQPYSATKAAIINLAESLKAENPALDIKLINPGFVKTPLTDKNDFQMPMMLSAEQAAVEVAQGLLSRRFEIHFPKKFTFLLKTLKWLPHGLYFYLVKRKVKPTEK